MHAVTADFLKIFQKIKSTAIAFLLLPAFQSGHAANFTFFGYSDCHFEVEHTSGKEMVTRMNNLPGTPFPAAVGGTVGVPRGIVMAGDLIDDGAVANLYPTQWSNYLADFGVNGEGRAKFPVFEGLGNHDMNENMVTFNQVKARNLKRKELNHIGAISPNGYHYSWDWDDVHFVNLNLFPGNIWHGEADAYGTPHHPQYSLDFLKEDLKKNVGNTGRPVVTIHHYRPIDENWWTMTAADEYQKVLQDYNVIFISTGHQGGGVNNLWRGINWITSNGVLNIHRITPDNKLVVLERDATSWGQSFQKNIFFSWAASGLPAAVNNGNWASNLSSTGATLSGKLLYDAALPTEVTVHWDTADRGPNEAAWKNSKALGVKAVGEAFATDIAGLAPFTTYHYRMRATNSKGSAWAAASVVFSTKGVLEPGWQERPIGYLQRSGTGAAQAGGSFTVLGSGRDIAEPGQGLDNFQFAYRSLEGNGEITARIASMTVNTREPKAGVMLRETLGDSSRNVAVLLSSTNGIRLSSRSKTGGTSATSASNSFRAPYWVRLVRNENIFTGLMSIDGKNWTIVGSPITLDMAARIQIGLAVTAGNRDGSRLHAATFDNVGFAGKSTEVTLGRPGSRNSLVRLRGFESAFLVPGRIGSVKSVQVFNLGGRLMTEASYPGAAAAGAPGTLDIYRAERGSFLVRFIGTGGTHMMKLPAR